MEDLIEQLEGETCKKKKKDKYWMNKPSQAGKKGKWKNKPNDARSLQIVA
jgi:hypothetical protein